jgi:hypothetical protein
MDEAIKNYFLFTVNGTIIFQIKTEVLLIRQPGYLSQYSKLLQAGRSTVQNPVDARFSGPIQTGPKAHLAP